MVRRQLDKERIYFIPEERAIDLIKSEVESNKEKGFIHSAEGFAKHCIDTARIGYEVAKKILERHPSLKRLINPELIRVQGYMHGFSKIYEGQNYHEIGTADLVLSQGDRNLGLVSGGSEAERREVLREMASLIPPDYALFEELGGRDFPDGAFYPDILDRFMGRIEKLRTDLSATGKQLTMEKFALPRTLNQQIALYADLTNVNGEIVSVVERMEELQGRYRDASGPYFNPLFADVTDVVRPRIIAVAGTIEDLMK